MGFLEKILGEDLAEEITQSFNQGKKDGKRKIPTQPGNLDEKDHRRAQHQAEKARQDIEPESLLDSSGASKAPIEVIDEQEQVQYLFKSIDLDIDGDDSGSVGYAMITNSRIVFAVGVLSPLSSEHSNRHSVLYGNISDISVGENVMTTSLNIRTQGHVYEVSGFDGEVANSAASYIREMVNTKASSSSGKETDRSLDKLEKLSELREDGAISEEEFEQKKQELLDDI